jgi:hypothetical protein
MGERLGSGERLGNGEQQFEPEAAGKARKARALGALIVVGAVVWTFWPVRVPLQTERLRLSPQECRTECQERQTDCILDCDGHLSCEHECVQAGDACVARCGRADDAGARPPGAAPAPQP